MKDINIDTLMREYGNKRNQFVTGQNRRLTDAINEANGKCQVRTITETAIYEALIQYERKLNIPKKYMDMIAVSVDINAESYPSAYKYTPTSTKFTAMNIKGKWHITSIFRGDQGKTNHKYVSALTEEAANKIIERYKVMD